MPGTSYAPAEPGNGPAAYAHRGFPDARDIASLQAEIRGLARDKGALIPAHNHQVPEVPDDADFVGDSLGLPWRRSAHTWRRPFAG